MRRAAVMFLIWVALAACRKSTEDDVAPPRDPNEPPPLEQVEKERGVTACAAYAERVCACASDQPALAEDCKLAGARPEALATALELIDGKHGKLAKLDWRAAQASARKTIKACFEADARLDPATCPRPSLPAP
jgi:hypothetical protein